MTLHASLKLALTALSVSALLPSASLAAENSEEDCYDALISARIIRQVPSVSPDCGEDCIIMSWPWFVDLKVDRVLEGNVKRGRLSVLTIQHGSYRTDLGARKWWLRRNSEGQFNVLRLDEDARPSRCPADAPPAIAYIQPGNGKTLNMLRREAEAQN